MPSTVTHPCMGCPHARHGHTSLRAVAGYAALATSTGIGTRVSCVVVTVRDWGSGHWGPSSSAVASSASDEGKVLTAARSCPLTTRTSKGICRCSCSTDAPSALPGGRPRQRWERSLPPARHCQPVPGEARGAQGSQVLDSAETPPLPGESQPGRAYHAGLQRQRAGHNPGRGLRSTWHNRAQSIPAGSVQARAPFAHLFPLHTVQTWEVAVKLLRDARCSQDRLHRSAPQALPQSPLSSDPFLLPC